MSQSLPNRGLTMLEVIIALSLTAVAALALLGVFTSGTRMMRQSTDLTMATDVGREFLEVCKADGHDALTPGHFDGRVPDPSDATSLFPHAPYPSAKRNNQDFQLVVDVTQETPQTRLVQVQIFWGNTHHTSLTTLVHR